MTEETTKPKIDFSKLQISNFAEEFKTQQKLTTIPIKRPKKTEFFRVRDGWTFDTFILEAGDNVKTDKEMYIVLPQFCEELMEKGILKPVRFFFLITWGSNIMYLSDVGLPDIDGKINMWNKSRLEHYETAKQKWVQISSNKQLGAYTIAEAVSKLPDPIWPKEPANMVEAIEKAFTDHVIDSFDHPELKKIRGEA